MGISQRKDGDYHFTEDSRLSIGDLDDTGQYAEAASSIMVEVPGNLFTSEEEDELSMGDVDRMFHHECERPSAPFALRNRYTMSSVDVTEDFEESASISSDDTVKETFSANTCDVSGMKYSDFVYPRSRYTSLSPLEVSSERDVMHEFSQEAVQSKGLGEDEDEDEQDEEYELSDFSVYLKTSKRLGGELVSLNNLGSPFMATLLFDGVISNGTTKHYVQGVPFEKCSIGNIGENNHQVGEELWLLSILNDSAEIYYKLKEPAPEYQRFHEGFLWLANLFKFFVDYLHSLRDELANLQHFKAKFMQYLVSRHGNQQYFQHWHKRCGFSDFRNTINANIHFLYHQTMGTDNNLEKHTIWAELRDFTAIPAQPRLEEKTIVTPYVYRCFQGTKFGHLLKLQAVDIEAQKRWVSRANSLQMPVDMRLGTGSSAPDSYPSSNIKKTSEYCSSKEPNHPYKGKIHLGDVLSVLPDSPESTRWKKAEDGDQDELWYAYVTRVKKSPSGRRLLNVIWLYSPGHTICGKSRYLFKNEIFFSDHCNCTSAGVLSEDHVVSKISVAFHGTSTNSNGHDFFIRTTYSRENERFITFQDVHKQCEHQRVKADNEYKRGETVLAIIPIPETEPSASSNISPRQRLCPCEIVDFIHDPVARVRLRWLRPRNEIDGEKHAPNEVVYTEDMFEVEIEDVVRRCHVRFYSQNQIPKIPPPYNRNGNGEAFFVTTRLKQSSLWQTSTAKPKLHLLPIDVDRSQTLIEGFDPDDEPIYEKLRGIDLFSGGGSFGRGLAEGGAISYGWAVDIDAAALHALSANLEEGSETSLFLGSVNDMLSQAIANNPRNSPLIPLPGDVDFISGGNPCVAFSLMNPKRDSATGLMNQSLVASVAAYVDYYRPKYAFFENVVAMAYGKNDASPLSQLICAMVGLGYQLQLFKLDAWSCGSPQSRSRLIVSLTAPGLQPPPYPKMSHSPPRNYKDCSLGQIASGEKFGLREFGATAFPFVSAAEATADLPNINDAQMKMCIPYPDHVVSISCQSKTRAQIKLIPRDPQGMNFYKTFAAGRIFDTSRQDWRIVDPEAILMTENEVKLFGNSHTIMSNTRREFYRKGSKAFGRTRPDGVFPPILCALALQCSRSGTKLHWGQHRPITIMEARRAQGFPDYEVVTGSPKVQYRIVGNSVARQVALALGLSLRTSWLKDGVGNHEIENQPTSIPKSFTIMQTNCTLGKNNNPPSARAHSSSSQSGALVSFGVEPAANSRGTIHRSVSSREEQVANGRKEFLHTMIIHSSSSEEDIEQEPFQHNSFQNFESPSSNNIHDQKRRKAATKQPVEDISSDTTSEIKKVFIRKGHGDVVGGAFNSLIAAIRSDKEFSFTGKETVKLRTKKFELVIRPINAESSNSNYAAEEIEYDENVRAGGKRRRH